MAATRTDPLTTFLFGLKIPDLGLDHTDGTAIFKACSGIKCDAEVQDYLEGGIIHRYTRKVIGVTKWPNLVLKSGFIGPPFTLWTWKDAPKRVDGTVFMLGNNLQVVCQWDFHNGYPVKWDCGDLDAGKNEICVETIEIAHEGLS